MASHRASHNTNRNGLPRRRLPAPKSTTAVPEAVTLSKSAQIDEPSQEPSSDTPRQAFVRQMDITSPSDTAHLRELLEPEYKTLANRQHELLNTAPNQYFLIHGERVKVFPTSDDALEDGFDEFPNDLFLIGRIRDRDIHAYLGPEISAQKKGQF